MKNPLTQNLSNDCLEFRFKNLDCDHLILKWRLHLRELFNWNVIQYLVTRHECLNARHKYTMFQNVI